MYEAEMLGGVEAILVKVLTPKPIPDMDSGNKRSEMLSALTGNHSAKRDITVGNEKHCPQCGVQMESPKG